MPKLALTRAFVITPFHLIEDGTVLINDSKIESVGLSGEVDVPSDYREISLEGLIIAPGLIDLHFHGDGSTSVMDGTRTSLESLTRFQAIHGVTSFLATTVSASLEQLSAVAASYAELQKTVYAGARCLGIHMEGPYFSPQFSETHPDAFLRLPSIEEVQILHRKSNHGVKLVTMAPELTEASVVAFSLFKSGISLSIGHSQASYETVSSAIRAGFTGVTHCFEHLCPLNFAEPGVVGALLTIPELWAEVIINEQTHPAILQLLLKTKGFDRLILASNFGLAEGGDGVNLTGQMPLDQGLHDFLKLTDSDVTDAFRLVTYNPAKRLGINKSKGSLYPGKDADIVVLTPDFDIVMTMVEGEIISGLITL